ncbi:MAG: aspartate-semialdehyde dehydrogenase [Candidatus Eremiobacteraeota bacterium]|nr:aspartate-semialdehyde dehydrogenase [Candidatus Eremiobacteraeota bacterium]
MKKLKIAVVGATGLVGRTILQVLEERKFSLGGLVLLATSRSAGKEIRFRGDVYRVKDIEKESFKGIDVAFFAGGDTAAVQEIPRAVDSGAVVIDKSSTFRMTPEVPLVVPEVNPDTLKNHKGIIASPNCSTIQMVVTIQPLHSYAKLKRIVVSTYQSVSGTGKDAVLEFESQVNAICKNRSLKRKVYPHIIAGNLFPHIDKFYPDGYTGEEHKMINETRKIMNLPDLRISATCVRVPVKIGHSMSCNLEFYNTIDEDTARRILCNAPGITVIDDPLLGKYPTPLMAAGQDQVLVGRIRSDRSNPGGLELWCCADNLRKGAAVNAVQIAEKLIEDNLL